MHKLIWVILVSVFSLSIITPVLAVDKNSAFEKVCKSCHSGGFKGWISGAPNIKKPAQWQRYRARHTEAQMREIVFKGLNDHDVKGGCSRCSDEEIASALDYIFKQSQESVL